MNKLNKFKFAMRQKYGTEWDTPLFARAAASTAQMEAGEPLTQLPDYIDDATEVKAQAYSEVIESLSISEQRNRVFQVIDEYVQATDNQIARVLKIHPSTVAARRNELRDMGKVVPVLDNEGRKLKRKDSITGIPNTLWRVVK